jgi:hypothetical protein
MGLKITDNTKPEIIIVEKISSSFTHLLIISENEIRKRRLHTNATLDKNNNQRIRFFRVK